MDVKSRILGSILGAAVGDAMGAVTETKTPEMIRARFGGYVEDLLPGPEDTFVKDCPAGAVTDDFSLAYYTAQELAGCRGSVTRELSEKALLTWASHPEYFCFAGPTTQASVKRIQGFEVDPGLSFMACDNHKATNGSAMKIFAVGLINPGDIEKAVRDTATVCLPTHSTNASISGASAISAAVAAAVTGASLNDVLGAGLRGARMGYELGTLLGDPTSVASVEKRMELAIRMGSQGKSWEEAMLELGEIIGSGIAVNEAVPCVFGILAATNGDTMAGIRMGVNIGNDTDTVATMVGAIAGAMHGAESMPKRYLEIIERINEMELAALANRIYEAYYR
ncbi:MAG: ADP-ribosylglycohydrolase family protein [Eubacteriales bacterium]|nr:ADP-ribosylglycohydrolase family protein [Eubacteriales bacterium]